MEEGPFLHVSPYTGCLSFFIAWWLDSKHKGDQGQKVEVVGFFKPGSGIGISSLFLSLSSPIFVEEGHNPNS